MASLEKNTHRALDVDEFRAYAMLDEMAPLIFVNGADSAGSRLFSLFHEMVHLWLGESDLYNDRRCLASGVRLTEKLCNAVAGELLVPGDRFLEKWDNCVGEESQEKIWELARTFRCSGSVVARKALEFKKIGKKTYEQVVADAEKEHFLKE